MLRDGAMLNGIVKEDLVRRCHMTKYRASGVSRLVRSSQSRRGGVRAWETGLQSLGRGRASDLAVS